METAEATKLSVYVGDMTRHGCKSSYRRSCSPTGPRVPPCCAGLEGFGSSGRIHTGFIEALSMNLQVVVVAVDSKEKVEAVLPKVTEIMEGEGLVTLEKVEVVSAARSVAGVR
jgi:PII-like signaling protein